MKEILLIIIAFVSTIAIAKEEVKINNQSFVLEYKKNQKTNSNIILTNKETGRPITISGNLALILREGIDAKIIAKRYNLPISEYFPDLDIVYLNTNNSDTNIFEIRDMMKKDKDIESVEVDTLKQFVNKRLI